MAARCFAAVALALVVGLGSAAAQTVDVTLLVDPGTKTYEVLASASLGDNFGIASYGVGLSNVDTIVNEGPAAYLDVGGTLIALGGFTLNRSGAGVNPANPLAASQDTINGTGLVRGMGQVGGDMQAHVPAADTFVQQVYSAPLLLGSGTYLGPDLPDFLPGAGPAGLDIGFNLFTADSGTDTDAAQTINTTREIVPEPATIALVTIGGMSLLGLRRRRRR